MNKHVNPNGNTGNTNSDEIDLKELLLTLWDGRAIIIAVTLLVTVAAAAYTYLTIPVYKAEATLTTPSATSQIALSYSYNSTTNSNLYASPFERETLEGMAESNYQQFIETLNATENRVAFFKQNPQFISNGTITINTGNRNSPVTTVTVSGSEPGKVADMANQYSEYAITEAKRSVANSLIELKTAKKQQLTSNANTLRTSAKLERQQRIAVLQEALQLAESLSLEQPATSGNLVVSLTGETAYMRGAQALRSEINLLQNRASDDNFIPELIKINQQLELLDNININLADVKVAQVTSPAIEPASPIKPRKNLIIAVGIMLGGMLGIFLVLMRNMFRD